MPPITSADAAHHAADAAPPSDAIALSWLVMVRWAGFAAEIGAVFAGWRGLGISASFAVVTSVILASAASNGWLGYRLRRVPAPPLAVGGGLVCVDVVALSWLLLESGGVLNPVSIFYLVDIVLAALVLGRTWTWIVTTLSISGYAVLFLAPSDELRAAQMMHPEIGMHIEGMWLAFGATALIVAVLVARLATLVERRDRALAALRDRRARDARLVSLVTLAAGAAHELSTPLGTIAVAARELERSFDQPGGTETERRGDVRLIQQEIDRCRRVLNDMAGRSGEPAGEAPTATTLGRVGAETVALLPPDLRGRIDVTMPDDVHVTWPVSVIARALGNLLKNGLQASPATARATLAGKADLNGSITITVIDRGHGMPAAVQARAGEPFYTTKPEGVGMGLGLFVATATIEQLGGSLRITSAEHRGTTVVVALPGTAGTQVRS